MSQFKFVSQRDFHAAARSGHGRGVGVMREAGTILPSADEGSPVRRFVFSDGSVDRMGDTIDPNGWELGNFRANPTILWAHDSNEPPIGRASRVYSDGVRLLGDIEFAIAESEFAATVFRLVKSNYLRTCSVGFLPIEWSRSDDPNRPGGIDFERQELLECSICPVPANPFALIEAAAKGFNLRPLSRWAERTLDAGGHPMISDATLIQVRSLASSSRTVSFPRLTARTQRRARSAGPGTVVDIRAERLARARSRTDELAMAISKAELDYDRDLHFREMSELQQRHAAAAAEHERRCRATSAALTGALRWW